MGTVRIVSGGQTGADRAALDWAIANGIPYGGWCPKGRMAEDGVIPEKYILKECYRMGYLARTRQNVIDSDGTVIFTLKGFLTGGSKRTREFADEHSKPWVHIHSKIADPAGKLRKFIGEHRIKILNVAGPRASGEPTIGDFVRAVLDQLIS